MTLHLQSALEGALSLANSFGPQLAFGRPLKPQAAEAAGAMTADALRLAIKTPPELTGAEVEFMGAMGAKLWAALDDAARGNAGVAATAVNELLAEQDVRPYLKEHDHGPWHLHFSAANASAAEQWCGDFTVAMAMLLGSAEAEHLKSCQAIRCERIFLDGTRNHSRRFCSTSCQTRAKVAAHRQRKQTQDGP